MDRVRPNNGNGNRKHLFQKGHKPLGHRKKGVPNKFTGQIRELTVDAMSLKGNALVVQLEYFEERAAHYEQRIRNAKDRPRRLAYRRKFRIYCNLVREYDQYRIGGAEAAMLWLQNKEPGTYLQIVGKLLPLQIQGKVETSNTHRFETVEEVEREFRSRGLPVPPRLVIDHVPTKERAHQDRE